MSGAANQPLAALAAQQNLLRMRQAGNFFLPGGFQSNGKTSVSRSLMRYAAVVLAVAALYLTWTFAARYLSSRQWERSAGSRRTAARAMLPGATDAVRILHFYASPAPLTEGEKGVLCYGVENAASVSLDPPLKGVSPSFNRCLEIGPDTDTRYTLTARGAGDRVVTESFVLPVRVDFERLPRIKYFYIGSRQMDRDRPVFLLLFETANAAEVRIDPPAFPAGPVSGGRFWVSPRETTTYTLTAVDHKGRKAERKLTVKVPPATQ